MFMHDSVWSFVEYAYCNHMQLCLEHDAVCCFLKYAYCTHMQLCLEHDGWSMFTPAMYFAGLCFSSPRPQMLLSQSWITSVRRHSLQLH